MAKVEGVGLVFAGLKAHKDADRPLKAWSRYYSDHFLMFIRPESPGAIQEDDITPDTVSVYYRPADTRDCIPTSVASVDTLGSFDGHPAVVDLTVKDALQTSPPDGFEPRVSGEWFVTFDPPNEQESITLSVSARSEQNSRVNEQWWNW